MLNYIAGEETVIDQAHSPLHRARIRVDAVHVHHVDATILELPPSYNGFLYSAGDRVMLCFDLWVPANLAVVVAKDAR